MDKPRKFGPFQVEKKIGSGGMGIVYRAVYTKTGQKVALKVLSPEASSDEQVRKRFDREMEILKTLDHKNVVKYYGGGRIGNQNFYAMELMDGGSLDSILRRKKKLTWEQVVDIGKAVARALEHAHYHGIIHRDLKPANLFLSKDGRLKLGDFGIARDTQRTALTAAGKTVGTYAYMAPEQISGKPPVSRKTDQYALGCVLFELLTGHPPFESDNPAQMLMQHLEIKPPRVTSMAPDCPIWLENVIHKLLEKDPEDRYFDSLAVYNALNDVTKKVTEGDGIVKRTVKGDVTVATKSGDNELRKILGKKKKKRKKKQPFYEQVWFLATCLILLVGVVTWLVWPMSDQQMFQEGKQLMEDAAALEPSDKDRLLKYQEAKEKYFEPLLERSPDGPFAKETRDYLFTIEKDRRHRTAMRKERLGQKPESEAERLYIAAWKSQRQRRRLTALEQYRRLIRLVKKEGERDFYVELAEERIDEIYMEDPSGKGKSARELIQANLKRAESLFQESKTVEANLLWNDIVEAYGDNKDLKPLVDRARVRLSGKKPDAKSPGNDGSPSKGSD